MKPTVHETITKSTFASFNPTFFMTRVAPPLPKSGQCDLNIPSGIFDVRLNQPNIGYLRRVQNTEFETDLWEELELRSIAVAKANGKFKGRKRIAHKE